MFAFTFRRNAVIEFYLSKLRSSLGTHNAIPELSRQVSRLHLKARVTDEKHMDVSDRNEMC